MFLKSNRTFGRVYFADLAGSGLCGLVFLGAMYLLDARQSDRRAAGALVRGLPRLGVRPGRPRSARSACRPRRRRVRRPFRRARPRSASSRLAVNDYKGVAYARKFPDAKSVYESVSPFGYIEAYSSSYLHFAPGLSDNAGFNLPTMPANAYLGVYIDSDGPIGIMRDLPAKETAYFRFLPMDYPYVIKKDPKTFITQFGGGISTAVALRSGSRASRSPRAIAPCSRRSTPM